MADGPDFAVVIGAYRRTEHLAAAVRSARAQTLPRERYEIAVIKTFDDPALDGPLAAEGATLLKDDEPVIGRWLTHAVRATRAPWIAFLDDDDEFEPDRLRHVAEVVRAHPDLGFYHSRVSVIDGAGRPIPPDRWRTHETDRAMEAGPVYRAAGAKAGAWEFGTRRAFGSFNTSAMVIRRELLDGAVGAAFERTYQEDQFLFLAGVLAPYGLYLDDRRLTRFRYYGGNVSHSIARLYDWAVSEREMAALARTAGESAFADHLAREADHYERMHRGGTVLARIGAGAGRREVARVTGDYLRFLGHHPAERSPTVDTWAAGLYGLGYVGAPGLIGRLARARTEARARADGRPATVA